MYIHICITFILEFTACILPWKIYNWWNWTCFFKWWNKSVFLGNKIFKLKFYCFLFCTKYFIKLPMNVTLLVQLQTLWFCWYITYSEGLKLDRFQYFIVKFRYFAKATEKCLNIASLWEKCTLQYYNLHKSDRCFGGNTTSTRGLSQNFWIIGNWYLFVTIKYWLYTQLTV